MIARKVLLARPYRGCPQVVSTMPTMCTEENPGPKNKAKLTSIHPGYHPGATARKPPRELICDYLSETHLVRTCQYFEKYHFKNSIKNQPCLGTGVIH